MPAMPAHPDPSLVRNIASPALGVLRDGDSLREAATALLPLATGDSAASDPAAIALMMVVSALWREESRGAHSRTDFPARAAVARRSKITFAAALAAAAELEMPQLARSA